MIRRLQNLTLFLLLPLVAAAQNGKLSGVVTDKDTKEVLGFVAVKVLAGGQLLGGAVADENGEYTVSPLRPGTYDVEYSLIGYRKRIVREVRVNTETTTRLNVNLPTEATEANAVVIEAYKVPLIDKDNTSSGTKLTAKDIEKLPTRNINSVIATTAGVFSNDDGGALNIRGNRGGDNIIYVNGVRQFGNAYPPVESIAELSVITGGVPAQYGDALGGVISITTKGAASVWKGNVQYETSRLFDQYRYDLAGLSGSGPLWRKKTTDPETGKVTSERTLLGIFGALQYQGQRDESPSALGYIKAKDAVVDALRGPNPYIRLDQGGRSIYRPRLDTLGPTNFERVKYNPNSAGFTTTFNTRLDFQPKENMLISFGGTFNLGRQRNFPFALPGGPRTTGYTNFFNYDNNNIGTSIDYQAFVSFRQSFPSLGNTEGGLGLKNFYYQIQADFSQTSQFLRDPILKDRQELYNYTGKFVEKRSTAPAASFNNTFFIYQPGTSVKVDSIFVGENTQSKIIIVDGVPTRYLVNGNTLTQGFPGGFSYEPFSGNPQAANINNQILNTEAGLGSPVNTLGQLAGYRGVLNGDFVPGETAFGLAQPGTLSASLGIRNNEQYRVSGQVAGDIKKHTIKVGFEYEQRVITSYGQGISPWIAANRLVNNQILRNPTVGTSLSTFSEFTDAEGVRNITINPDLPLVTDAEGNVLGQTDYDRRLRSILGYPINKLININELDPSLLAIRNFTTAEIFGDGLNPMTGWQGYNAFGDRIRKKQNFFDFFTDTVNRPIDAFRPIYTGGYIEDKFEINDLIVRAGVRFDRFDVNQPVLRDPYSLTKLTSVGETDLSRFENGTYRKPSNIGDDYAIYLDKSANTFTPGTNGQANGNEGEFRIRGYRDGNRFFNATGQEVSTARELEVGGNYYPLYNITGLNSQEAQIQRTSGVTRDAFRDFKPQLNIMPRIAFSFPISEDALFYAHYDILTQRPQSVIANGRTGPITFENYGNPSAYYSLARSGGGFLPNPNLNPQKKIDYQVGFQQRLSPNTAFKISAFYSEIKDLIQVVNVLGSYPISGYLTNANQDFGIVKGSTMSFDYRKKGSTGFGFNASYTLQFAEGSASDFARALINTSTPNLRNIAPQNWDQRHAIKLNFDYRIGKQQGPSLFGAFPFQDVGLNMTFYAGSGAPYTVDGGAWGGRSTVQGSVNGARLPFTNRTGLRVDKTFFFKGLTSGSESNLNIYLYVQNLFDQRNILEVYRRTGRADDDGYLSSDFGKLQSTTANVINQAAYANYYNAQILNPNFISLPRRIRIGASYTF